MTEKMRYKKDIHELTLIEGEFDETTALGTNQKGKLVNSTGDFIGLGWEEEEDILITNQDFPNDGVFGGSWGRYTQSNIAVDSRELATKDGNRYAYVIKRAPDITSTSTWGGVSLFPPAALQRLSNHKFRFSFDYRGYSGGYTMDVYQNYSIGWGNFGINLPTPWSNGIGSFDTDWEWENYSYEFTVQDVYLNAIAGHFDWDANTQYVSSGYYGVRYNGDLYRHNSGQPAPTLGVDPATEYASGNGAYSVKWVGGAAPGYFNVYNNIKIGFTYQGQNARGTHVHIDNITLTDITNSETWKYDLTDGTWRAENLTEDGLDILAKGTSYIAIARSDNANLDVFAVEGNRFLSINGTTVYNTSGRGLRLTVFNSSGSIISDTTYDTHGVGADRDSLATALAGIASTNYWTITSFDAIGTEANYNSNPNLRNKLVSMGSKMWNTNESVYLWSVNASQTRNTYAAVGKGQNLIKEDGANGLDSTYKRKGVIQTRIS